ncbi:hypothetical protein N8I77_006891 [Diaporthe amygdali]|uniref:Uncharacterized protein n=1 Tax=Phomopsis amygdali TaxID=1214568 RepID=A0AAD9SIA6_PHOAM|nr:uncharacterized protein J7T55_003956 [Diaporthe amygdali]KAJ0117538.1 hypothetical protein J7T55_003956 [Diaporthe amygdali]KAK2608270.1 hypothetical protein N8I77_006891 [Diaporthe amygdali]
MDAFTNKTSQQPAAGGAPAGQKDDYVDKAFAMGAKKSGHNVDKNTAEKITDGARGLFEKATGKKVDPKISN